MLEKSFKTVPREKIGKRKTLKQTTNFCWHLFKTRFLVLEAQIKKREFSIPFSAMKLGLIFCPWPWEAGKLLIMLYAERWMRLMVSGLRIQCHLADCPDSFRFLRLRNFPAWTSNAEQPFQHFEKNSRFASNFQKASNRREETVYSWSEYELFAAASMEMKNHWWNSLKKWKNFFSLNTRLRCLLCLFAISFLSFTWHT